MESVSIPLGERPSSELSAGTTDDAPADSFDNDLLAFWERFGLCIVARLALPREAIVLDLECETDTAPNPAGKRLRRDGYVIRNASGELGHLRQKEKSPWTQFSMAWPRA
jgi:hypothetical protein